MGKYCPACGKEVNDAKFCPNCGKPVQVGNAQQSAPLTRRQPAPVRKRTGCLIPILVTLFAVVGFSIVISMLGKADGGGADQASKTPSVSVIMDAPSFAGISLEELTGLVGELEDGGTVDVANRAGDTIQGHVYNYPGSATSFVLVDNVVISFQYWAEDPIPYKSIDEIFGMFAITPSTVKVKEADTGASLRYSAVSENVSDFWIQSMDTTNKTFEIVKITLDSNYAGRFSTEPKPPALEVISQDSTSDGYYSYVTGKVRNNTEKTYSYVQIQINLFKGDVQVGSTMDNINNLAPGGIWEFKAIVLEQDSDKYKIVDVTGF